MFEAKNSAARCWLKLSGMQTCLTLALWRMGAKLTFNVFHVIL